MLGPCFHPDDFHLDVTFSFHLVAMTWRPSPRLSLAVHSLTARVTFKMLSEVAREVLEGKGGKGNLSLGIPGSPLNFVPHLCSSYQNYRSVDKLEAFMSSPHMSAAPVPCQGL